MTERTLTGWGRTAPSRADVLPAFDPEAVERAMSAAAAEPGGGRGLLARGLGRSYGDAAQNAGGVVLDTTALDGVRRADLERGEVTVGAGTSLQTLMARFVPEGWFVPVTPGTRQVTVGGAVAADVHGKNHHVDGSFCQHVSEMQLVTPTGRATVSPEADAELFWATAGGMGLTGLVTEATVRLLPVETSYILVDTDRAPDLDAAMDLMVTGDDAYRYSVAWIDCQAGGARLGRSVLTRGDHARMDDLPRRLRGERARAFSGRQLVRVPVTPPSGLLNRLTIAAFNEAVFRRAPTHEVGRPTPLTAFFHPLDAVGEWNRLYGRRGFVQYQ
ncbi:MAG TPA: FAD-binding oxidoreductase, partial [Acidimicrobiales bacterium]|nr:FAD-binding oxidoreductase [Acidimicrobiales bacterium]